MQRNPTTVSFNKNYLGKTRWTQEEVSSIRHTLCQLHNGTDAGGLDQKPIKGANPLYSVRVSGGIRMVLYKTENDAANEIIALRVGRKPNIHRWAKRNHRRGKLSSLTAQDNLVLYQPERSESKVPTDFPRTRADGATRTGHIDIQDQTDKPKPRSGSKSLGRGRRRCSGNGRPPPGRP